MSDQPDQQHADQHLAARDAVALAALGEPLDEAAARHLVTCPECQHELAAYRQVVALVRTGPRNEPAEQPPPAVWDRIAAATGAGDERLRIILTPTSDAPAEATGNARLRPHDTGELFSVDASGLPSPEGYYAVWLSDRDDTRPVALGVLGPDQRGVWTIPPNVDRDAYRVVTVSAQRFDRNPGRGPVLLRGSLPTW